MLKQRHHPRPPPRASRKKAVVDVRHGVKGGMRIVGGRDAPTASSRTKERSDARCRYTRGTP